MNKTEELLNILKAKGFTLGSAESFTAGLFASEICSVSGASQVFKGAVVCYNKEVKEKLLSLDDEFINKYDVVSKEVAYELAKSCKQLLDVDIAISFTGNAGPTSEPGKAKVGETYIGINILGNIKTYKNVFLGERNEIRNKAVEFAIDSLLKELNQK